MASISVIIPTYNRASTIGRAVKSALDNAPSDSEVIVVDDASEDRTEEAVRGIDDPRVTYARLSRKSNGNAARNHGVAISTGSILAFLDSDDVFDSGRAVRLVRLFADQPQLDAVSDAFRVNNHHRTLPAAVPSATPAGEMLQRLLVLHAVPLTCSAIALRRSTFEAIGGFDPELRRQQDRDLLLRLAPGHRVALGTGADVVKVQSPDSLSRRAVGYVAALDAIVARHPVFRAPENRDVLAYLSIRMILRSLLVGRVDIAAKELKILRSSSNLPRFSNAIGRYLKGRMERKQLAAEIMRGSR